MTAIAWLGMYDHPGQQAANDALWAAIRDTLRARGLRGVPSGLTRGVSTGVAWSHPGLLLGMICTRPWALAYPTLRRLGHPVYAGTAAPGEHRSVFVVRADDPATDLPRLRGRRAAINDAGSNTGAALLRDRIVPLATGGRFFGAVVETGSHRASAGAVRDGAADVAAIDEVTFAAIARFEPDLAGALRIIGHSDPAATPVFVTAAATPVATVALLREALAAALADPALAGARALLDLTGVTPTRPDLAGRIAAQDATARAAGYPVLG